MVDTVVIVIRDTIVYHDTIITKGAEIIDIVKKVDDMYSNAWNRLLIFGGMLSVIIPSLITWFLQRKLRDSDIEFNTQIAVLKIADKKSKGFIAHLQGEFSRVSIGDYSQAISDYFSAVKYYIEANDEPSIRRALNAAKHSIYWLSNGERKRMSLRTDIRKDLDVISVGLPKIQNSEAHLVPLFQEVWALLDPDSQK